MLPRPAAVTPDTLGVVVVHVSTSKRLTEYVWMLIVQLAETLYDGLQSIHRKRVVELNTIRRGG